MNVRIILLPVFLFCLNVQAQNKDPMAAYAEFKRKAEQQYDDFRRQANKRYADFLKSAWEAVGQKPPIPQPKDETVPPLTFPADSLPIPVKVRPIRIEDVVVPPQPEPQPQPLSPLVPKPLPNEQTCSFTYCGTAFNVRLTGNAPQIVPDLCSNEDLAAAWTTLADDQRMDLIVSDCLRLRDERKLCDWAYLNMLSALGEQLYGKVNAATFFTAFVYCQSGYQMRLARYEGQLTMLYSTQHTVYKQPYYFVNNKPFYPYAHRVSRLEVCKASFPQEKPLSLLLHSGPQLESAPTPMRSLESKRYADMKVDIRVNKNLIDFFDTYPSSEVNDNFMTRWAIYANTPLEQETKDALYPQLTEKIAGLSQLEAAERLLNWVQTAFVYEYDEEVWGYDRPFFAEETLFYPYCDCEDRAILFTRLVRDLLGLKCILVYYPGHLACAVNFTDCEPKGDYIQLGQDNYTITDPTFIGAPVGRTMTGMDNSTAKVIALSF